MTDDRPSETQQELFDQFSPAPKRLERFPTLAKTQKPILISTTLEQLLMVSILLILLLCGVFFLGVLRGKSLRPDTATPVVYRPQPTQVTNIPASRAAVVAAPAPAVVPQAVSKTPATSAEKPYTIQLVTYRKREYAEAELSNVRKMGFSGYVVQKGEYFLVYAGQYASKEEAKRDMSAFQAKYKDSFLTRRA